MTKYSITIIVALVVLNLFTLFNMYSTKDNFVLKETGLKRQIKDLKAKENLTAVERNRNFITTYTYSNRKLSPTIKVYRGKNEEFLLKDLIDSKKLIYRISDNTCEICYDDVLNLFTNYSEVVNNENLIIIVPLDRIRELKVYLEQQNSDIPFYGIKKGELGLEVDKYYPFLFLLEKDMDVEHVFVPSKNEIQTTKDYLDIIKFRNFEREYQTNWK